MVGEQGDESASVIAASERQGGLQRVGPREAHAFAGPRIGGRCLGEESLGVIERLREIALAGEHDDVRGPVEVTSLEIGVAQAVRRSKAGPRRVSVATQGGEHCQAVVQIL